MNFERSLQVQKYRGEKTKKSHTPWLLVMSMTQRGLADHADQSTGHFVTQVSNGSLQTKDLRIVFSFESNLESNCFKLFDEYWIVQIGRYSNVV